MWMLRRHCLLDVNGAGMTKRKQNPRTRMQKQKLRENCNTATLATLLSATLSYSTYSLSLRYSQLLYLLLTQLTKCCTCHDYWHCVMFVQPCHCDSSKQHLGHVTKSCTCHEIAKYTSTKYCTCKPQTQPQRMSQNATQTRYLRENRPRARHPDHTLWAPPNGVRLSDLTANMLRWCANMLRSLEQRWANTTPTSRPPDLNENPSLRIPETHAIFSHSGNGNKNGC